MAVPTSNDHYTDTMVDLIDEVSVSGVFEGGSGLTRPRLMALDMAEAEFCS